MVGIDLCDVVPLGVTTVRIRQEAHTSSGPCFSMVGVMYTARGSRRACDSCSSYKWSGELSKVDDSLVEGSLMGIIEGGLESCTGLCGPSRLGKDGK